MTWLLAASVLAAIGLAATAVGFLIVVVRRGFSSLEAKGKVEVENATLSGGISIREQVISKLEGERAHLKETLAAEIAARKQVEKQRDDLIDRLVLEGDPASVAIALRRDLDRLSKLSDPEATAAGEANGGNDL